MNASVAVCVITYRRPEQLRRCLRSIADQKARQRDRVRLVVVDNDPSGSAAAVRPQAEAAFGDDLIWAIEPRRGIPYARNRAVALARAVDFVAFIDDDEVAQPGWLSALLDTQATTEAQVVAGPVRIEECPQMPDWWFRLGAHSRPDHPNGATIDVAATNNVLVSVEALRRYAGPFNTRLAAVGGSDTELFMRLRSDGFRMVWSSEAVVVERLAPSRLSLGWLARRRLRGHSTWVVLEREVLGASASARLVRSMGRVTEGLVRLAWGAVRRQRHEMYRGILHVAGGAGGVVGSAGYAFEEYGAAGGRRLLPVRIDVSRTRVG